MLEMIKARKERGEKGFTLAELLIVVAIIAVLIAIAIPVFTSQLEKSREATDLSNIRAAYAEAVSEYLANGATQATSATVAELKQTQNGWQTENHSIYTRTDGTEVEVVIDDNVAVKGGSATVQVSDSGVVSVVPGGSNNNSGEGGEGGGN